MLAQGVSVASGHAGAGDLPTMSVTERTLRWALTDEATVERYTSKVLTIPGWECSWWSGAVSGRGHGRFFLAAVDGRDVVVIAHRFGFGLVHGADALMATRTLGHGCDNPLCQRQGPTHVRPSSALRNRREWAARRLLAGNPLGDRRGARGRSRALRDALRGGREVFEAAQAAGMDPAQQLSLWSDRSEASAPTERLVSRP